MSTPLRRLRKLFSSLIETFLGQFSKENTPNFTNNPTPKILVSAYCGLGDMVFMLPLLQSLRRWKPQANIVVLGGPYSAAPDLLKSSNLVNEFRKVDWQNTSEKERRVINNDLKKEHFDACLIPYTSPVRFFLPALYSIPIRIGHVRHMEIPVRPWTLAGFIKDKLTILFWEEEFFRRQLFTHPVSLHVNDHLTHDIDKHLALARELSLSGSVIDRTPRIELTAEDERATDVFLDKNSLKGASLLGFSLGVSAGMEWKQWPIERMAELIRRLCDEHNLKPLLFGSSSEMKLAEIFKKHFRKPVSLALGQTSVLQMAALLKRCRIFVSNDSGPSKLALALKIPTAIIWGPSDRFGAGPWELGPFFTIANEIECSPCYAVGLKKRGAGVINYSNCGHRNCLNQLTVEEVYRSIKL